MSCCTCGHVRDQRRDHELDLAHDIQQRRAAGRPAAAGEQILLAVDRQMVEPLGLDDRGRHAGVVTIAFDQRRRPFGRGDAAVGIARAGVLGILLHQHVQLGTLVDQRLGRVVADDRPLAVRRAGLCESSPSMIRSSRRKWLGSDSLRGFFFWTFRSTV